MPTGTEYRVGQTDADKVKRYDHRMFIAQAEFDKEKDHFLDWWHRYENLPRRKQVTGKGHRVNVPTGVSVIDSLFSMMTAVNIDVILSAKGATTRPQAELATAALSHEWDLLGIQSEGNAAIKDASVVGIGWVKVGYEYSSQVSTDPRPREDVMGDLVELMRQASAARSNGVKNVPEYDDIVGMVPIEEEVEHVLRDRIVVDYVPWDRILVDSTAKRIEDVKWVAQVTPMRVEDVRDNAAFQEYVKRTRGGTKRLKEIRGESTFEDDVLPSGTVSDDDLFVKVYEFWDLEAGTVCTFIKGQDWLLNESANPFALNLDYKHRNPFVPCVLRKTATRLRGVSDMELIAPSLDEADVYRSATATFVERFVPKVAVEEDALTVEGKAALANNEYGAVVSYATGKDAPVALNPPVLPAEVFDMDHRIEETIRDAVGSNELTRGQFPDRKRTATETSEVVSASNARHAERRNTLETFWSDVANRVLQLMQLFYDQKRMTRYVDPTYGAVAWEWDADDVAMEYGLSVSLTPKEEPTAQSKRDDALAFFNFMVPLAQPGPDGSSPVDIVALVAWLATEYGISKQDQLAFLNLPEEKQAQQLAAQQNVAAMGSAAQGQPNPGLTTGPLDPGSVAALTNQGAVPPEVAAASAAPGAALSGQAVEAASESAGVRLPGGG
jgi:hypothetical protein